MWNHKSANNSFIGVGSVGSVGDVELNSESGYVSVVDEKLEKHVDLSNYLTYLHSLFNKPTSDSEGSDSEICNTDEVQNVVGFGGNSTAAAATATTTLASNFTHQDKFLSSVSQDGMVVNATIGGKVGRNYANNTITFEASQDLSNSSHSSQNEVDDSSSFLPNDLTPMSDLELNNLLRKTNYLGPDADPISFELEDTSTTDSDNKKNTKKKKKKSKKKNDDGLNHRHNKPNSDGKGNGSGHSRYGGNSSGPGMNNSGNSNNADSSNPNKNSGGSNSSRLSNSRTRKQSLKFLRAEASNNSSSSSSQSSEYSFSVSVSNARGLKNNGDGIIEEQNLLITRDVIGGFGKRNGKSTFSKKSVGTPLSQAIHNSAAISCAASSNDIGLSSTPERLSRDDDDNNSLSDYISMAATVAVPTAQVPSLPLHLGDGGDDGEDEEEDFDFDEKLFNSICMKLTYSTEDSIPELNSPQPSNSRKRKFEVDTETCSNEEPESKRIMLHKSEKLIELLNLKRRKIYVYLAKKEVPKSQRTLMGTHKEAIAAKRKLAQACTRFVRQKAVQSQKIMKESAWRAKRLTKEMQSFWKQADRAEKELRRRLEKQAEEQRKLDEGVLESKRHLKNLNFIITQTELYAQTVAKKLSRTSLTSSEELDVLKHLNESEPNGYYEDTEWEATRKLLKLNVERAIKSQSTTVKQSLADVGPVESFHHEFTGLSSSKLFKGDLKMYQIKGVQWLMSLYNQGINGILADDNELGKVGQSVAFLCYLAERRSIWGPFLVVAPSSQIQNWHQEFTRLVKDFKVILYTGNPQERKALRSSWNSTNNLSKKDAVFHVVISTCQTVSTDLKYLNKINWRYFIVDEAHSTKSPSCSRWKALLSFSCRNRLLISKPPVVNGIGEIWSLLHFLAPSLYESKDEFNEWFSKDIESLVENKKLLNESLSRLQTSLVPFILKRTKRDVESGLTIIKCPLSFRQKSLYRAIKLQIKKEEVKHSTISNGIHNSTVMNLVAQLRKICNHPDLVEERHACSSLNLPKVYHYYPILISNRKCSNKFSCKRLLETKFNIFNPVNIHRSLFCDVKAAQSRRTRRLYHPCDISVNACGISELANGTTVYEASSEWSFLRLLNISYGELWNSQFGTPFERLELLVQLVDKFIKKSLLPEPKQGTNYFQTESGGHHIPLEFSFVQPDDSFYTWGVETLYASTKVTSKQNAAEIRPMQRIMLPEFLCQLGPKVISKGREPFFISSCSRNKTSLCDSMFQPKNGYEETDSIYRYFKAMCPFSLRSVIFPERDSFINDCGKFIIMRKLLSQLLAGSGVAEGNKIIICSRTCKMIDLLQEFLARLKIACTRIEDSDLVDNKYKNLEVIFYDSDSSISSDQQMIDRVLAHEHTQQFVVYRLICKGTIEDAILFKGETIRGKQDNLKIKDIVGLVHDDDDWEKHHQEPEGLVVEPCSSKATSSQAIQSSPEPVDTIKLNVSWNERKRNSDPQVATSLISNVQLETSYGESMEGSLPPSPNLSDEIETDFPDVDFSEATFDESVGTPTSSSYFDEYGRPVDWNDYEEDMTYISKKPRIGRGTGKRGRPPSRVRVQMREVDSGQIPVKRGPGRPRLRPIGPPNQGVRGRRPGRPPLSKKAETVSSSLTPLTPSQRVFGIYSSPDINMS